MEIGVQKVVNNNKARFDLFYFNFSDQTDKIDLF